VLPDFVLPAAPAAFATAGVANNAAAGRLVGSTLVGSTFLIQLGPLSVAAGSLMDVSIPGVRCPPYTLSTATQVATLLPATWLEGMPLLAVDGTDQLGTPVRVAPFAAPTITPSSLIVGELATFSLAFTTTLALPFDCYFTFGLPGTFSLALAAFSTPALVRPAPYTPHPHPQP